MNIAVVANCQGESLAKCLQAINPVIEADFCITSDIENGKRNLLQIIEMNELIFVHRSVYEQIPIIFRKKVVCFPSITFMAFHPDMTYLRARNRSGAIETILSPMVMYHSAIAVFGYLHNISIEVIEGFYNSFAFSHLGYLDEWLISERILLEEGDACGFPLGALLSKWKKSGCFMYSLNHPEMKVMFDIALTLLKRQNIKIINPGAIRYLEDPLKAMPIWPIYPEIGHLYGLRGDYTFKRHQPHHTITRRQFLTECYAIYSKYERNDFEPLNFSLHDFNHKLGFSDADFGNKINIKNPTHPYSALPRSQFWKNSVADVNPDALDPTGDQKFAIQKDSRIATAGSCFAQHIAKTLSQNDFNYYVTETAPLALGIELAQQRNYGVFSARYGNIYTARQLLQLLERVNNTFVPQDDYWERGDGRYVDPFRPQIDPAGFETIDALRKSRASHFLAVNRMLRDMDIFVFTLGLTEGWRSRYDGAVFPLAPGVAGGSMDIYKYEFINFSASQIQEDLEEFIDQLKLINPNFRMILTVSPVPLIATYENKHALVATTYSKSSLRVAAENIDKKYSNVEYFPSYEIITGSFNKGQYFDKDLRTVTNEGINHVMRIFTNHYLKENKDHSSIFSTTDTAYVKIKRSTYDIVCDEEAIAKF